MIFRRRSHRGRAVPVPVPSLPLPQCAGDEATGAGIGLEIRTYVEKNENMGLLFELQFCN